MNRARCGWVAVAALSGFLAVVLGALAAHALTVGDPGRFDLAWRFHVMHVLAMLIVAVGFSTTAWVQLVLAGFLAGSLVFCGTLYWSALHLAASTALAPIGGSLLMASWLLLAIVALRSDSYPSSRSV